MPKAAGTACALSPVSTADRRRCTWRREAGVAGVAVAVLGCWAGCGGQGRMSQVRRLDEPDRRRRLRGTGRADARLRWDAARHRDDAGREPANDLRHRSRDPERRRPSKRGRASRMARLHRGRGSAAATKINIGAIGANPYTLRLAPGSLRRGLPAPTQRSAACNTTPSCLPSSGGRLLSAVALTSDGKLDIDIPVIEMSGAIALQGNALAA